MWRSAFVGRRFLTLLAQLSASTWNGVGSFDLIKLGRAISKRVGLSHSTAPLDGEECCVVLDAGVFEKGGERVVRGFAGVFLAAVNVKELELSVRLSFDHSEPTFENCEDSVREFVGNEVDR